MPYDQRKTFTLIELLAVSSIILILLALLLPALKNAKEQTEQQYCKNMMKERRMWGIGYENDNNNNILPCSSEKHNFKSIWFYQQKVYSSMDEAHYREEGVSCPSDPNPNRPFTDSPPWGSVGPYKMSMLYNAYFGQKYSMFVPAEQRKTTEIEKPGECGVMIDGHIDVSQPTSRAMPWMVRWGMATWMVEFRHAGTTNILYFDGHTGSYNPVEIGEIQQISKSMGQGI